VRTAPLLLLLALVLAAAGCGGGDDGGSDTTRTTTKTPAADEVPARGYTCGELRSAEYRDRQADALLDERGIEGAKRARLKRRLVRALFVARDPGPDYRRAAQAVAREVLGPE
jgi:hypothetical protein